MVKLKFSAAAFSNGAATAWATEAPCGSTTSVCSSPLL